MIDKRKGFTLIEIIIVIAILSILGMAVNIAIKKHQEDIGAVYTQFPAENEIVVLSSATSTLVTKYEAGSGGNGGVGSTGSFSGVIYVGGSAPQSAGVYSWEDQSEAYTQSQQGWAQGNGR